MHFSRNLSNLNNFCPISDIYLNLPQGPRKDDWQLIDHMNGKRLFDQFQSGHSTDTAFLRGLNDILLATVLLLLDFTAAFDTVDHMTIIEGLKHWIGISGTVSVFPLVYLKGHALACFFS